MAIVHSVKRFGLIGAAGFIAPRHLKAIKDTGNDLVCALDKFDSVGILDNYFPSAEFFTEFERFDRYVEKLRFQNEPLNYLTVCSPNYLHDAHIRFGLRNNCNVICEKPIVLNPWNIAPLEEMEKRTDRKVYNILQLRLHPAIIALKNKISTNVNSFYDLHLSYITSRGNWYYAGWKGDVSKSGGVATNIGVHFFDMLCWLFGEPEKNIVHVHEDKKAAGFLQFRNANVRWFLSLDERDLPEHAILSSKRTFRELTLNNESFEFSDGFTELHTESYKAILSGNGFSLADAAPSIKLVHNIRTAKVQAMKSDYHPYAMQCLK